MWSRGRDEGEGEGEGEDIHLRYAGERTRSSKVEEEDMADRVRACA